MICVGTQPFVREGWVQRVGEMMSYQVGGGRTPGPVVAGMVLPLEMKGIRRRSICTGKGSTRPLYFMCAEGPTGPRSGRMRLEKYEPFYIAFTRRFRVALMGGWLNESSGQRQRYHKERFGSETMDLCVNPSYRS